MKYCRLLNTRKLGAWWNVRKVGFRKRLLIYSIVVISTTLYVVFPIPILRLTCLLVFLVSAEFFAYVYTPRYLSNLWLLFTHKKATKIDIPIEITNLLNQMNVKIDELRIRENFCNAYVKGKSLVLGRQLLEQLDIQEALAVVAHELAHIKEKHYLFKLLVLPIGLLSVWSWFGLPFQILFISWLAYATVIMIPVNWVLEYRADMIAMRFSGSINLRSALLKLANANRKNLNEPSEDHPSIAKRLKLIRSMNS